MSHPHPCRTALSQWLGLGIAIAAFGLTTPAQALCETSFVDLPTDRPFSTVFGTNEQGISYGSMAPSSSSADYTAALFRDGQALSLGTTGGNQSVAHGMNSKGQVVGRSTTSALSLSYAALWSAEGAVNLGSLGEDSIAYAINDSGHAVGQSRVPAFGLRATLWSEGAIIDLGTLGGPSSRAYDINRRGDIVGWADNNNGNYQAVVWRNGSAQALPPVPGDEGGSSYATKIADNGDVLGLVYRAGSWRGVVWRGGTNPTELGAPENYYSLPLDINASGLLVGEFSRFKPPYFTNAVAWYKSQVIRLTQQLPPDLVAAGWSLESAHSVNDKGEITAQGVNDQSRDRRNILLRRCDFL